MTQEEIVYAAIRQVANTDKPEKFAEINQTAFNIAMKVAELMQPSLPEGLEAAAKEFSRGKNYPILAHSGFVAGARWMAGQGYSQKTRVYFNRFNDETEAVIQLGRDGERGGFNPGDKVIIQIRKNTDNEK